MRATLSIESLMLKEFRNSAYRFCRPGPIPLLSISKLTGQEMNVTIVPNTGMSLMIPLYILYQSLPLIIPLLSIFYHPHSNTLQLPPTKSDTPSLCQSDSISCLAATPQATLMTLLKSSPMNLHQILVTSAMEYVIIQQNITFTTPSV